MKFSCFGAHIVIVYIVFIIKIKIIKWGLSPDTMFDFEDVG